VWRSLGANLRSHKRPGFSCAPRPALLALLLILIFPPAHGHAVSRDAAEESQPSDTGQSGYDVGQSAYAAGRFIDALRIWRPQPSLALFRAGMEHRPHDGVKIGTLTDEPGQIFGTVFEFWEPLQADEPGGAHVGEPVRIWPSAGSNAPELASQIVGDCAKGIFVSPVGFVRVAPIFFSRDCVPFAARHCGEDRPTVFQSGEGFDPPERAYTNLLTAKYVRLREGEPITVGVFGERLMRPSTPLVAGATLGE
jgi:hypothetical protein